jgi:hypothetical protein
MHRGLPQVAKLRHQRSMWQRGPVLRSENARTFLPRARMW